MSRLIKVFADVLPKLKNLNLQVQAEMFIELVEASPLVRLQLQELSITLSSGLDIARRDFASCLRTGRGNWNGSPRLVARAIVGRLGT